MTVTLSGTGISVNSPIEQKSYGTGTLTTAYYGAPNTFTKPAGLKYIKVTIYGAGGGGGASGAVGLTNCGGFGGFGQRTVAWIPAPNLPASAVPITVPTAGGAGGAIPSGTGTAGSPTIFGPFTSPGGSVTFTALGGGGGASAFTSGTPGGGGAGNVGGPATISAPGVLDGITSISSPGAVSQALGYYGALSPVSVGAAGGAAPGYGAGGGGGRSSAPASFAGGAGGAGVMIIESFF